MNLYDIRGFRDSVRLLQRSLGWQAKNDAECCGITIAQCHALLEIGNRKELSLVDLAGALGLDSSTLSRTIDTMVAGELVERSANPDDRRYITLSLDGRGREIYKRINLTYDHYYQAILSRIPVDKQQQVIESIGLLARAVIESEGTSCCVEGITDVK
jgi:DNA-binding MarR family transcriptional regulator